MYRQIGIVVIALIAGFGLGWFAARQPQPEVSSVIRQVDTLVVYAKAERERGERAYKTATRQLAAVKEAVLDTTVLAYVDSLKVSVDELYLSMVSSYDTLLKAVDIGRTATIQLAGKKASWWQALKPKVGVGIGIGVDMMGRPQVTFGMIVGWSF